MTNVKMNVEYCGACGHSKQFLEMAERVRQSVPSIDISGKEGRQASFEIHVNDELVYSKLQTMAFPDFDAVANLARDVSEGKPVTKISKEQPINCCIS